MLPGHSAAAEQGREGRGLAARAWPTTPAGSRAAEAGAGRGSPPPFPGVRHLVGTRVGRSRVGHQPRGPAGQG